MKEWQAIPRSVAGTDASGLGGAASKSELVMVRKTGDGVEYREPTPEEESDYVEADAW